MLPGCRRIMSNSIVPEGRFWHGRRVFITGHTGFVGGWLAFWLAGLGARVAGYALPPPPGASLFETLGIGHRIDASVLADVRDLQSLAEAVERSRADVIFHLAAQPLVLAAHADPVGTFDTNVMGTVNLLEAARRAGSVSAVVVFTTDKVYENREGGRGYRESDALGGHEPYGLSKAAAELAVAAWRESFFRAPSRVGVATVRAGNIIGGGDWAPDRIVPDPVRAIGPLPMGMRTCSTNAYGYPWDATTAKSPSPVGAATDPERHDITRRTWRSTQLPISCTPVAAARARARLCAAAARRSRLDPLEPCF